VAPPPSGVIARTGWPAGAPIPVTVNGNPGEVVAAIQQLERPDVTTRLQEAPWYARYSGLLLTTAAMTISLAVFLALYYAIYCAVWALLSKLQRDNTLIGPV